MRQYFGNTVGKCINKAFIYTYLIVMIIGNNASGLQRVISFQIITNKCAATPKPHFTQHDEITSVFAHSALECTSYTNHLNRWN